MADGDSAPEPLWASAAKRLRETAKWLAGGIIATSASVFVGSSLTHLGSLDVDADRDRLLLALGGAALGFASLGWLMRAALGVLTVDSASLIDVATGKSDAMLDLSATVSRIFRDRFPEGTTTFGQLYEKQQGSPELLTEIEQIVPFLYVKQQFSKLTTWMWPCAVGAILGFGLFAWAANPPDKPKPEARGFTIKLVR